MQKIIDYEILYEDPSNIFAASSLTNQVRNLIKSGWQPLGHPFVTSYDLRGELKPCTAQAMVKYAEAKAADKTANKTETKID